MAHSNDVQLSTKNTKKAGIIYLSRIPPFLNSNTLRSLLNDYGEINRIYLKPENKTLTERRKKLHKNRRKCYTCGWVEFKKQKTARKVAEMLNNRPVGGSIKNRYRADLWNMKYLKKFKWNHLVEQLQYEKEIKDVRMREILGQAEKEEKFYRKKVAQKNFFEHHFEDNGGNKNDEKEEEKESLVAVAKKMPLERHFVQKKVVNESVNDISENFKKVVEVLFKE